MSKRSGYIPVSELFAAQFTPDGGGFIYRKSGTGEAKQGTIAEKDSFLATFTYRRQYLSAAAIAGVILLVFFIGIRSSNSAPADGVLFGGVTMIGLYWIVHRIMWCAPDRALRSRPAIAGALPGRQARRVRLSRLNYEQLFWIAIMGLWVGRQIDRWHDGETAWDALGWTVSAGCMLFAAVQAFRKWRIERIA